ncbi:hypothetical protein Tco_0356552 [Tanacetum coccineum]
MYAILRMDNVRALVDIWANRALKDTMLISILNHIGNGVTMHTIMVKYEWKLLRCVVRSVSLRRLSSDAVTKALTSSLASCDIVASNSDDISTCLKRVMTDLRKSGESNNGFQTIQKKAFCGPHVSKQGKGCNHSMPKQQVPKSAYHKKTTSTMVFNTFSGLEEDSGKPIDDLVDDTRRLLLHYFDRDDMEFDDKDQVVEEAVHGNASRENG